MRTNMFDMDRSIRFLVAVTLVILSFTHAVSGGIGMILLIIATTLLVTSYTGFCPFYWLFGFKPQKKSIR
jgi:hypothetical protein